MFGAQIAGQPPVGDPPEAPGRVADPALEPAELIGVALTGTLQLGTLGREGAAERIGTAPW